MRKTGIFAIMVTLFLGVTGAHAQTPQGLKEFLLTAKEVPFTLVS